MSSEDMSNTMVQLIEPGNLGREPNVSTNEYFDYYGIIQDVKATHLKSVGKY
jgi:hypothetical protein